MLEKLRIEKKVSGTKEWASRSANFISGCGHDCKYCYAKSMSVRFKRKSPESWKIEEINHRKLNACFKKKVGYIMFPSSHDVLPEYVGYALEYVQRLLDGGNKVLFVTKPHLLVVQEFCNRFVNEKERILFRFTIGSCNSETLKFWEPGAPTFKERFEALKYAYDAGFQTSVSAEPALDTNTLALVDMLLPYVTDAIWIGKPNRLRTILKLNGSDDPETMKRANDLINAQSNAWAWDIYEKLRNNPKIKWKDSLKIILGIGQPAEIGMDV